MLEFLMVYWWAFGLCFLASVVTFVIAAHVVTRPSMPLIIAGLLAWVSTWVCSVCFTVGVALNLIDFVIQRAKE